MEYNDTQIYSFSNVNLKLYDNKKRLLKQVKQKNTVTKYALNGIASLIKGEFNDTNYVKVNSYVPKYLALGTNEPSMRHEGVNVSENVTVRDTSLLSEVLNNNKVLRIGIEESKRVDNRSTNEYIKIRYRATVVAGFVGYKTQIRELGLFVDNTDIIGGLWARIAIEPITIPENSLLDVTWDIILASSIGVYATSIDLVDSNGSSITQRVNITNSNNFPISAKLKSSVKSDRTTQISAVFNSTEIENGYISYNNFNPYYTKATYTYDSETQICVITREFENKVNTETFTISDVIDEDNAKLLALEYSQCGYDDMDNKVTPNGFANMYINKDVTYRTILWQLLYNDNEILNHNEETEYTVNDIIINGIYVYICKENNQGTFNIENWDALFYFNKYLENIILFNINETTNNYDFKLKGTASTGISDMIEFNIGGNE